MLLEVDADTSYDVTVKALGTTATITETVTFTLSSALHIGKSRLVIESEWSEWW
jgi:hypothetical protein